MRILKATLRIYVRTGVYQRSHDCSVAPLGRTIYWGCARSILLIWIATFFEQAGCEICQAQGACLAQAELELVKVGMQVRDIMEESGIHKNACIDFIFDWFNAVYHRVQRNLTPGV